MLKTINSSSISISFVRRVIPMNSIFFRPLPLLKKEDNKEKPRHFTRSKCISKMHCALLQGKQRQKLLLNRLHVWCRFSTFRLQQKNSREISNKFSASILHTCAKLFLKPSLNVSSHFLQNCTRLPSLSVNEAVCSAATKVASEQWNLTLGR